MWRLRSDAIEIRQREAIEIRQRQAIKIRQREAIEIRQSIGGGRANDGQGGYGHHYRRHPARSPLLCRLRLFISLRFFIWCFSHLRSLLVSPVARFFLAADQQNKKEPSRGRSCNDFRAMLTQIRLKSWAYMVNDQLFSAVSRGRRSAAGCRPFGADEALYRLKRVLRLLVSGGWRRMAYLGSRLEATKAVRSSSRSHQEVEVDLVAGQIAGCGCGAVSLWRIAPSEA
jgi:hypothetical protein